MSEYTPETLRTDAEKKAIPYFARLRMRAHADAWEKREGRIEALEKAAKAYLNWHRRQKLEPESPADFLNDELEEDRLGDELCAALAAKERKS